MSGIPIIGSFFGGPKTPAPPPPVDPVERRDPRAEERARIATETARTRGRASSVLTSELGDADPNVKKRRLGAA